MAGYFHGRKLTQFHCPFANFLLLKSAESAPNYDTLLRPVHMISSPLIMAMLKYLWSTDFSATKVRSPVSLSASVVSQNHDSIVYRRTWQETRNGGCCLPLTGREECANSRLQNISVDMRT